MQFFSKALPNVILQKLVWSINLGKILIEIGKIEGKSLEIEAKFTKIGKNLQNIKNKYTNVYLIRSSMENGLNKYIYKK